MNIDRKLNLVIPVEREDGSTIYVHAAPLTRETFDKNFLVMAKAYTALHVEGLGAITGPRVAAKMLRQVAAEKGLDQELEKGFFAEMHRLMSVITPAEGVVPYHAAVAQKMISDEDVEDVENAVTFFTLASAMHRRQERLIILEQGSRLWGAQISSSSATEFAASLQTSTKAAATGPSPSQTPFSIPA